MENPEKGIVERTDSRVRFVSNTTGDDDGIDVTLDAPAGAVIRFRSPVIDLDVPLADLQSGATRTVRAGGIDLRVFMRRLPARGLTRAITFEHVDPLAAGGRVPRVLDPRHAGRRRPSLDQPRLPQPGRR